MAMNVTPFVGTDNFDMATFNNMISQINSGVNSEISDILAQLGTKAKIQTGTCVGTGTYGADNPCSLTFDFEPKLVLYFRKSGPHEAGNNYINFWSFISFIWLSNVETYLNRAILAYNGYSSRLYTHFTLNGNTLSFYGETSKFSSGSNTSSGINDSNTTYFFVGIG